MFLRSAPNYAVGSLRERPIPRRHGYTLVEIMVVVVIIGLLAAIAIPAFKRVQERSAASRIANDLRQYAEAIQRYNLENGQWPPSGAVGTIPVGLESYLPAGFTNPSPIGGQYSWSGLPTLAIRLTGATPNPAVMTRVDAILDDGNLSMGDFQQMMTPGSYHLLLH